MEALIDRDEMPNRCMALLKLRTREEAQLFLETFNGKPFISMLDVRSLPMQACSLFMEMFLYRMRFAKSFGSAQ